MNIEIDLDDYISEEDKKELARDIFIDYLRKKIPSDYERILSNLSYNFVFKMIDDEMGGKSKEFVKTETLRVINELSVHKVFRDEEFHTKRSIGQQYLDESVAESKELIKDKVLSIVSEKLSSLSLGDESYKITEIIEDVVGKVIYEKLTN